MKCCLSLIQPDNASISLFPGKVLVEKGVESAWSWIGYCVGHVYLQATTTHSSKATQVNLIHPVTPSPPTRIFRESRLLTLENHPYSSLTGPVAESCNCDGI